MLPRRSEWDECVVTAVADDAGQKTIGPVRIRFHQFSNQGFAYAAGLSTFVDDQNTAGF